MAPEVNERISALPKTKAGTNAGGDQTGLPFDFGFVPSTLGEDGDPLDILILMDAPVVPGCVIRARAVGAIEAKQKAKGESWQRNDRLIVVATHAQTHENVKSLADLRPHLVEEIKAFFVENNRLRGRKVKPLALSRPGKSRKLIDHRSGGI